MTNILKHAKRPYSSKDRLIECAVDALHFFKGDDIRRFALKQMRESSRPQLYTSLLIANYKQGDGKKLRDIVDKVKNQDAIHDLAFSYKDIYEINKTAECLEPLMALYDWLIWGICRGCIVEKMIENNVLPERNGGNQV